MGKINIYMPSLGEGIIEASVIKLLKEAGDKVEQDDAVIEIATDKVDTEIVAPEAGVIDEIKVKPGDVVKVGEVVVIISTSSISEEYSPSIHGPEGGESFILKQSSKDKPNKISKEPDKGPDDWKSPGFNISDEIKEAKAESPMQEAVGHSGIKEKVFLSPLVKKISKEEGLSYNELISIKGSGYLGRITRDDVLNYIKYKKEGALHGGSVKEISVSSTLSKEQGYEKLSDKAQQDTSMGGLETISVKEASGGHTGEEEVYYRRGSEKVQGREGSFDKASSAKTKEKLYRDDKSSPGKGNIKPEFLGAPYIEKDIDRVRMLIGQHTLESKRNAPHVTSFAEVDMSCFYNIKNELKEIFLNEYGLKLTYTPLFIAATAKALERFYQINASLNDNKIRYYKHINMGIATALDNGNLIVPVIKNTEGMNLRGITDRLIDLTQKARSNKLDPADITGGTFTITNFGSFNTMAGTPIILQPQSAILGIGEIKKRVVVIESENGDSIGIRPMCIISLSFDHRIIDGALAGKFLGYLKECIEDFRL